MPFPTRKDEPYVDRLIYFFDTVGWLIRSGILTMDEVGLIAYQAQRVLRNSDVQAYLHLMERTRVMEDPLRRIEMRAT